MRIAGVDIPNEKRLEVALTYIFGVGRTTSQKILAEVGLPNKRTKELSSEEVKKIQDFITKNYRVEGNLKREIAANIKRLKEIKAYRGVRHARRLPVRGQRTKTNTRTIRGNVRVTMGSGRRKLDKK
ncbi:MAG: 30S ribosomal protein S13 [Parcubacteria group bacterium GW2011_GWB1_41_6]|nr:MAG: 30S ribosomal protein S13 [Parcubacteria group bacterium GW2011_GWB1_41_6]KKS58263.1 MAG: 30S ribosomal protein S13 [Parcubacteria group bacterium GW2011_GWA2_42_35]KKS71764.1 MAG: 30S ribosomal protein S13 [Parcubacteria group bacterium GW2011_GWF2_42_7]